MALLSFAACGLTILNGGTKPFLRSPVMYRGGAPELPMLQLALPLAPAAVPQLVPAASSSPVPPHFPVHTATMGLGGRTWSAGVVQLSAACLWT